MLSTTFYDALNIRFQFALHQVLRAGGCLVATDEDPQYDAYVLGRSMPSCSDVPSLFRGTPLEADWISGQSERPDEPLDYEVECAIADAKQKTALAIPTLVTFGRIVGYDLQPMSDDGSCAGYYDVPATKAFRVPPQGLAAAKASLQMPFLLETWFGAVPNLEAVDYNDGYGMGSGLERLQLIDCEGNLVAEAELNAWTGEVRWLDVAPLTGAEIAAAHKAADDLVSEAATEAGWDNFDTAKGLRAKASALRRKVEIAQNAARVAP